MVARRTRGRIRRLSDVASIARVAILICAIHAGAARAQDLEVDWDRVNSLLEAGQAMAQSYLPPEWMAHMEALDAAALKSLLDSLHAAMEETTPEALGSLQPSFYKALAFLRAFPEAEPLISWMESRAPYLDMARESVTASLNKPGPPPPPPPPPGPETVDRIPPPAPPRATWKPSSYWMSDPKEWDRRVSGRAAPKDAQKWARRLAPIFREEGLPEALVWVAEVESSFRPGARSPAGAVGLYQLMPATAKQYGLRVAFPDERKAPEKNARAAARYLRALHNRFQSWPLALAAYNSGPTRVARLLQTRKTNRFEAIRDALPVETQMYVPRVSAVLRARAGAELEKLPGPRKDPPDEF
jgi:membrane-bound lytic murein transglycosylase D